MGWAVTMIGLFLFAVLGTLALMYTSVQLGLPPDPELAGPMMIALFGTGFICLNQLTNGAMWWMMWGHRNENK